jgi:hypothetical protein
MEAFLLCIQIILKQARIEDMATSKDSEIDLLDYEIDESSVVADDELITPAKPPYYNSKNYPSLQSIEIALNLSYENYSKSLDSSDNEEVDRMQI